MELWCWTIATLPSFTKQNWNILKPIVTYDCEDITLCQIAVLDSSTSHNQLLHSYFVDSMRDDLSRSFSFARAPWAPCQRMLQVTKRHEPRSKQTTQPGHGLQVPRVQPELRNWTRFELAREVRWMPWPGLLLLMLTGCRLWLTSALDAADIWPYDRYIHRSKEDWVR